MGAAQDLILLFRKQASDEDLPYLWDDEELLTYLIDAQDMLVRAQGGIVDYTTAALCNLTVTAGTPLTAHSPYILRIRSGRLLTSLRDIRFGSEGELVDDYMHWDYGYSSAEASINDDTFTGPVAFGILGMAENSVRWYPVPDVTETCRIRIYRLPYPRPNPADQDLTLEVGSEHHLHLLKWVKYHAYSKKDAEASDPKLAAENRADFEAYCEKARRETERRRYKPRQVRSSWPTGRRR